MSTHEEYRDMLAAYALGALKPAEAERLDAALARDENLRKELARWSETAALIAYAAPPFEPPRSLRTRILAAVAEAGKPVTARVQYETVKVDQPPVETSTEPAAVSQPIFAAPVTNVIEAGSVAEFAAARPHNVLNVEPVIPIPRRSYTSFFAVAAALVILLLGAGVVFEWTRARRARNELAAVSTRLHETETRLASVEHTLAQRTDVVALLTAQQGALIGLAGTDAAQGASARLAYDSETGRALLIADKLPAAPAGSAYQFWYIAEGKAPVPGGVFTPDSTGHAELFDNIPAEGKSATTFAVTLEPAQGVTAPTGKVFLKNALKSQS